MSDVPEIVITGLGVVSPIGIGVEAFWQSLRQGKSGVRRMPEMDYPGVPVRIGAPADDFDPRKLVRPRKSLKLMSRDIQLGVAAAELACGHAGLRPGDVDSDRLGVIYGEDIIQLDPLEMVPAVRQCLVEGRFDFGRWGRHAMAEILPLWMLKHLPNMSACHVGIAQDARGPNNTITLGEVSSLLALAEAARVIQRGQADAVIAGGAFCRVHPTFIIRSFSSQQSARHGEPERASRPFDLARDGMVNGEGAGAMVLETRAGAEARGATIYARLLATSSTFGPPGSNGAWRPDAIGRSIDSVLVSARLAAREIGHVNAHGLSTTDDDAREAAAIRAAMGDAPVTALKSYFGNLGSGGGLVELAASILSFSAGWLPPTLNYEQPDPRCPVNVVHGDGLENAPPVALKLSHSPTGQSAAVLVAGA